MENRKLIQVIDQWNDEVGLFTVPYSMDSEKVHNRIVDVFEHMDPEVAFDELEVAFDELEKVGIVRVFVDQEIMVHIHN